MYTVEETIKEIDDVFKLVIPDDSVEFLDNFPVTHGKFLKSFKTFMTQELCNPSDLKEFFLVNPNPVDELIRIIVEFISRCYMPEVDVEPTPGMSAYYADTAYKENGTGLSAFYTPKWKQFYTVPSISVDPQKISDDLIAIGLEKDYSSIMMVLYDESKGIGLCGFISMDKYVDTHNVQLPNNTTIH